MAKIKGDRLRALIEGATPTGASNPYIWSSTCWEAFEFGRHILAKGLTLGVSDYWEAGRGNTYSNPYGMTWKAIYGAKGALRFDRVS